MNTNTNTAPDLDLLQHNVELLGNLPALLAIAEQMRERLEDAPMSVQDSYDRANVGAQLANYGIDDLRERFPGWDAVMALQVPDHKGLNALGLLMELELLCQAPELAVELLTRARNDLRTALLAGVSLR